MLLRHQGCKNVFFESDIFLKGDYSFMVLKKLSMLSSTCAIFPLDFVVKLVFLMDLLTYLLSQSLFPFKKHCPAAILAFLYNSPRNSECTKVKIQLLPVGDGHQQTPVTSVDTKRTKWWMDRQYYVFCGDVFLENAQYCVLPTSCE